MTFDLASLQGVMVIVGPIVLAAVLLWAVLHNRTSRRQKRETEEATRRNYDRGNVEESLREP